MERRRGVSGRLAVCVLLLVMVYCLQVTWRIQGGDGWKDTDVKDDFDQKDTDIKEDLGHEDTDIKDDLVELTETPQTASDGESNAKIAGEVAQMETTRRRNNDRLHHLKTACQEVLEQTCHPRALASLASSLRQYRKLLPGLSPQLDLIKVSPDLSVAVCVPYKAGSETWRYLLAGRAGQNFTALEQVADSHRAIQVREPYERLLSAYRFVFEQQQSLRNTRNLAEILMSTYSHLPASKDATGATTVSFPQFISSIVSGEDRLPPQHAPLLTEGAALHWLPYHAQCPPCSPHYRPTALLKMETWLEDTGLLLSTTNLANNGTFFLLNSAPGGHSSDPVLLRRYYGQVEETILRELAAVYQLDFKLFGYDPDYIFQVLEAAL